MTDGAFIIQNVRPGPVAIEFVAPGYQRHVQDDIDVRSGGATDLGRIPVETAEEADATVAKILKYEGRPRNGSWRRQIISVADDDKRAVILPAHRLRELGFDLVATEGTAEILARNGIAVKVVAKYSETQESGEPNVVDLINAGEIDMVVNTPSGGMARADGYEIRAAAVAADKALFTTIALLGAAVSALPALREGFEVRSLQEYAVDRASRS